MGGYGAHKMQGGAGLVHGEGGWGWRTEGGRGIWRFGVLDGVPSACWLAMSYDARTQGSRWPPGGRAPRAPLPILRPLWGSSLQGWQCASITMLARTWPGRGGRTAPCSHPTPTPPFPPHIPTRGHRGTWNRYGKVS